MFTQFILFASFVPSFLLNAFFGEKFTNVKHRCAYYSLFSGAFIVKYMFSLWADGTSGTANNIALAIGLAGIFGSLIIFGTCRMVLRIWTAIILLLVNIVSEISFAAIVGMDSTVELSMPEIVVTRIIGIAISYVMLFVIYNFAWRKYIHKASNAALNPMFFILISQWMCVLFFYCALLWPDKGFFSYYVCAFITVLSIIGDVGIVHAIRQLEAKHRLERDVEQMERQTELYMMQYRNLRERSRQESELRHEFKNQMQTVLSLIETDKTDTAVSLLKDVSGAKPSGYEFCANEMINAVMCGISEKCRDGNILLETHLVVPEKLALSARDICSLFANLLDNAVEACEASGTNHPFIKFDAGIRSDMLILHLVNSKSEVEHPKANRWRSTKADASNHGYGTRIINDILSRCHGDIMAEDRGETMDIVVNIEDWKVQ